jgi:hypothetical protein
VLAELLGARGNAQRAGIESLQAHPLISALLYNYETVLQTKYGYTKSTGALEYLFSFYLVIPFEVEQSAPSARGSPHSLSSPS